jgi:hypothetical protein
MIIDKEMNKECAIQPHNETEKQNGIQYWLNQQYERISKELCWVEKASHTLRGECAQ